MIIDPKTVVGTAHIPRPQLHDSHIVPVAVQAKVVILSAAPQTIWIFITNTTTVNGRLQPDIPAGVNWVGNRYEKNAGNVQKYVLKTDRDISGEPGVFGPITQEQIQAALDAEGGITMHGWKVGTFKGGALDGLT